MAQSRVSLVANMMMRNEALFIPEVLPRLQELCDRVILRDNGSTDGTLDICNGLLRKGKDVLIEGIQDNPINYAKLRNDMLWKVNMGEWVLKWDADELPSDGMVQNLRSYIESNRDKGGFTVPCYHIMKEPRMCLPIEVGWGHMSLFKLQHGMKYSGQIHEQINVVGRVNTINPKSGIAIIHFSYFAEKRFRKKAEVYATLPGSGFSSAAQLTSRLSLKTVPLPDYITYTANEKWLKTIQES